MFYAAVLFVKAPRTYFYDYEADSQDKNWFCGPFKEQDMSPIEEVGMFPGPDQPINRFIYCFLLQFSIYTLLYM
jgi:hypothetical protein